MAYSKEAVTSIGLDIPLSKDRPLEQLQDEFSTVLRIWQQSSCRTELLAMFKRNKPAGGWQFNKVVCIGSGEFHSPKHREHLKMRVDSLPQFACVMDIAEQLQLCGHVQETAVAIIAQDPEYTKVDRKFLSSLGVKALHMEDKPEETNDLGTATAHLGPHTLLFDFCVPMSNSKITRDILESGIGMHIGTNVYSWRQIALKRPDLYWWILPIITRFEQQHHKEKFSDSKEFGAIKGSNITRSTAT